MAGQPQGDPGNETSALAIIEAEAEASVRRVWHDGRWFFSVIDVVGMLTEAANPRNYWNMLKSRMSAEGASETYTKCVQLKMKAADGKMRLTDAADAETLLRIIQSVPSPKAEPFKLWLARAGRERLQEEANPALAADRLRKLYAKQGYSNEWIGERLRNIVIRDELTSEWHERGAQEGSEFAQLTDTIHRGAFDVMVEEHKAIKHLKPRHNLRDSMTTIELALTSLGEATSALLHQKRDSQGFTELQHDASEAGEVAGSARKDVEARAGQSVISDTNYQQLRTERQRRLQPPLFDA